MASTFKSAKAASGIQPRAGLGVQSVTGEYEIAAALVINDVIEMVKIPAGACILEVILVSDDLDTAGPSIILDVGDGSVSDRFIDGSTVGGTAGVDRLNEVDGLGYVYAAEDTIDIKVQVAPTTGAASGTLRLMVLYTMDK
jgi:hypothetical protein